MKQINLSMKQTPRQKKTTTRFVLSKVGVGEGRIGGLGLADANYYMCV